MATRAPKACVRPMCPNMAEQGKGYCHEHKPAQVRDVNVERDRFYDTKSWINTRNKMRALEPLCRMCLDDGMLSAMEHVDHIIRKEHMDNPYDLDGLMSLCRDCHSKKTREEQRYYIDGMYSGTGINPYESYLTKP